MIGSACSVLESPDKLGVDCESKNIGPGADLRNCDLSNEDLSYANLEGANLQGADLSNASLFKANFNMADLRGVNLDDTPLVWVYFTWANLQGASLVGASLRDVNFKNADLTDANFMNAELIDVDFTGADLTGADRINVKISRVKLPDGTMVNKGWGEPEPGAISAFFLATRGPKESKWKPTAPRKPWIFGRILFLILVTYVITFFVYRFLPKNITKRKHLLCGFLGAFFGILLGIVINPASVEVFPVLIGLRHVAGLGILLVEFFLIQHAIFAIVGFFVGFGWAYFNIPISGEHNETSKTKDMTID
jgi:hypothetical protein